MLMLPVDNAYDTRLHVNQTFYAGWRFRNVSLHGIRICWIPAIIDRKNNTIRNEREKWQEEIREKLERCRNRYRYRQQKRGERERDRKRPTKKRVIEGQTERERKKQIDRERESNRGTDRQREKETDWQRKRE